MRIPIEPRLTSRAKAGIRKALFEDQVFRQLLVEAGHLQGGSGSAAADAAAAAAESKVLEEPLQRSGSHWLARGPPQRSSGHCPC